MKGSRGWGADATKKALDSGALTAHMAMDTAIVEKILNKAKKLKKSRPKDDLAKGEDDLTEGVISVVPSVVPSEETALL